MRISNENNIKVLRELCIIVAVLVSAIALFDMAFRAVLPAQSLARMQIDIQSPETLFNKLDEIRKFEGRKVVFLGDSLIFGRTMRDHGDSNWQSHTLSSRVEALFSQEASLGPTLFINLGMNGTVPVDLAKLVDLVLPLDPDLIVFDLTLRSFSQDFESDAQSRPWLDNVSISPDGRFGGDSVVNDLLVNHWYFYRYRDTLQAIFFDGQPSSFLAAKRDEFDNWLSDRSPQAEDPFILLYKAQQRYQTVDLLPDNPQVKALVGIVEKLVESRQPTLAFYATEKESILEDLIDRARYDRLQEELATIMDRDGAVVRWQGPLKIYDDSDYLDHVHLNETGYSKLAQELYPVAKDLLLSNQREN